MVRLSGDRIPAANEASGGSFILDATGVGCYSGGEPGQRRQKASSFSGGSLCFFCHVFAFRRHVGVVGERRWMSPRRASRWGLRRSLVITRWGSLPHISLE